jgi:TPR repeat protein
MLVSLLFAVVLVAPLGWLQSAAQPTPADIPELKRKAEAGDSEAQRLLALAYDEGNGVPLNPQLGVQLDAGGRRSGKCRRPEPSRSCIDEV